MHVQKSGPQPPAAANAASSRQQPPLALDWSAPIFFTLSPVTVQMSRGSKGQMELYLRWLTKHDQETGDQPPLGIILCTGKKREQIELLELDKSGIHVAEYLTVLPPRAVFEHKIHEAMMLARRRMENKETDRT